MESLQVAHAQDRNVCQARFFQCPKGLSLSNSSMIDYTSANLSTHFSGATTSVYRFLIKTIVRTYDRPIVKAYVYLRFKIINPSILNAMLNYFEKDRRMLTLGCGFGLFDLAAGLRWPDKTIVGVDLDKGRIRQANTSADRLRLENVNFQVMDLSRDDVELPETDEILLLDLLHHIPIEAQERIVRLAYDRLSEGGMMVVKDIHTAAPFKLFFTWLLDMIMTRWEPVYYRSQDAFESLFTDAGFKVITIFLDDILPYPHVLYVCTKPSPTHASDSGEQP